MGFTPAELRLDEVLAEVGAAAPALQEEAETVAVSEAGIGVAGAWDDPSLAVMAEELPLPGGEAHGMIEWRLSQTLDVFGRRGAAKAVARAQHSAAVARRARAWADARARASEIFFDLWMIDEMDNLMGRQIEALESMKASARSRYVAGLMMAHHDLLRAEAEAASMAAARASLVDERQAMAAMLNTLRGRPPGEVLPRPVLPPQPAVGAMSSYLARVEKAPELARAGAMQAEMAARRAEVETMGRPMVMVGGLYQQRLGGMEDSWGAEVALTLPWLWDRQDTEEVMAAAMVRQADRAAETMARMAEAEVRMAWSRVRGAERGLEALEASALPQMRAVVAADEAAYVAGMGDLLRWLEDREALLRLEGRRLEAIVERARAFIELERLLGSPVGP